MAYPLHQAPTGWEYVAVLPVTSYGLLIEIGKGYDVNGHDCISTFQGYNRFPDGSMGPAERGNLIRNVGDPVLAIDGVSAVGKSHQQVIQMFHQSKWRQKATVIRFGDITYLSHQVTMAQIQNNLGSAICSLPAPLVSPAKVTMAHFQNNLGSTVPSRPATLLSPVKVTTAQIHGINVSTTSSLPAALVSPATTISSKQSTTQTNIERKQTPKTRKRKDPPVTVETSLGTCSTSNRTSDCLASKSDGSSEKVEGSLSSRQQLMITIVKKCLWVDDLADVRQTLCDLKDTLSSGDTKQDDCNCIIAVRKGAPLALYRILKKHKEVEDIQESGICLLARLAQTTTFEPEQINLGALEVTMRAMNKFRNNCQILLEGSTLFRNLMKSVGLAKHVVKCDDGSALRALVKGMRKHPSHAPLQERGCRVLSRLVECFEDGPAAFCASGGLGDQIVYKEGAIEALVHAMRNHTTNVEIQKNACFVLHILAIINDGYRKYIIDARGLETVARAVSIHQKNDFVLRAANKAIHALFPPMK